MLLMDGVRYEPWVPPNEEALAEAVKEHAKDIFGEGCLYFGDLKKRIKSAAGTGSIPDGWAIVFGTPTQAYPVEIEHSSHDVYGHISPQIDKIHAALNNPATQHQVVGALYDAITQDVSLYSSAKANVGANDLHKVVSDSISKQHLQLAIIIDSASQQLRECAVNKSVPPRIVEFATFRRVGAEAVHIHQFEPLFAAIPQAVATAERITTAPALPLLGQKKYYGVTLSHLIQAGLLKPGQTLSAKHRGTAHHGKLLGSGEIQLADGTVHKSPSGAAAHLTGTSMNGWGWWYADVNGQQVCLLELRKAYGPTSA